MRWGALRYRAQGAPGCRKRKAPGLPFLVFLQATGIKALLAGEGSVAASRSDGVPFCYICFKGLVIAVACMQLTEIRSQLGGHRMFSFARLPMSV